jgi:hypothetical protein
MWNSKKSEILKYITTMALHLLAIQKIRVKLVTCSIYRVQLADLLGQIQNKL